MEFLEGSAGVYRPIRVLFDTPIYDRALQLCWHVSSYKSQIALMMQLLRLQQVNSIPSHVTAEDMINLILEESKNTLRERLWEFELEDFDEDEAKPLLMLVWAVNVCNKMRDVEFEAQMLLNSPESIPPNFQHPKVLSVAQDYAKILRAKKQEAPSFKLLCPREVVMEVVPRVLQGFWVLPPQPLLNMASQKLSKLSIGVTKAVLDRVSNCFPSGENQSKFCRSIRDDMVLSILTEIRQMHPHDILVNMISSFAPVLLTRIVDVAAGHICGMFQLQSHSVSAQLTPTVEPPATIPVQDDFSLTVTQKEPTSTSPKANSAAMSADSPSFFFYAEHTLTTKVQTRETDCEKPRLVKVSALTREPDCPVFSAAPKPPAEPVAMSDVQDVPENPHLKNLKSSGSSESPEPRCITEVQVKKGKTGKCWLKNDPKPTTPSDSAVVPAPPHPVVIPSVHESLTRNLAETKLPTRSPETDSVVSSPPIPWTFPTEPLRIIDVQDKEDSNESPIQEDFKRAKGRDSLLARASQAFQTFLWKLWSLLRITQK